VCIRCKVGLLYAILAALLSILAFLRDRHSQHDFADPPSGARKTYIPALATVGQEGRVFGRPFLTAGRIVVLVGLVVAGMEIVLLVLLLRL
jgi:hypothetical protein